MARSAAGVIVSTAAKLAMPIESTTNETSAKVLPEAWFEVAVDDDGHSRRASEASSAATEDGGGADAIDVVAVNWAGCSPFAAPPSSVANTVTRVSMMTVHDAVTGCGLPPSSLLSPMAAVVQSTSECSVHAAASGSGGGEVAAVMVWFELLADAAVERTVCRYWNEADAQWSSAGLAVLAFYNESSRIFLGCVSLHLTAFAGMEFSSDVSVAVNTPDVGLRGADFAVSRALASGGPVIVSLSLWCAFEPVCS